MKKIALVLICLLSVQFGKAQQGKDGVASITTTSIVNVYTFLTSNVASGSTNITVASTTGFSAGDLIDIIQMQGAMVMDSINYYGTRTSDLIGDTAFGKIKAYNGAGNNEFAEVTSVSGNIITIDCALKNSYSDTSYLFPGNTQIIRVPRYVSLTLSGAGLITCPTWNGHTGGVVAIEVQGNTSIGAGTSINVVGMGFRGGAVLNATGYGATNTGSTYIGPGTSSSNYNNGAHKGESIAGDTNVYKKLNPNAPITNYSPSTPYPTCKGNVANGGGGGNAMNCGGGGGSNGGVISQWNGMGNANLTYSVSWALEVSNSGTFRPTSSSGGGRGGYAFSSSNQDPTLHGPDATTVTTSVWGSDKRHNDGGWGGIPLDYSTGKLFLGGGGGAGDENNNSGTDGGNGGGIVYLLSYGTVTGAGQILADGAKAPNTNSVGGGTHGDDGAGGGGGGGGVFINSTGNINLTNTLSISAQGGGGGNFVMILGATTSDNFGPGGGGGGGYISTTNVVTGTNVNGGANGIVSNTLTPGCINTTKISTMFPPNGATSGGAGTITTTLTPNFYLTASVSPSNTVCASSSVTLSVTVSGTAPSGLSVNWYTVATGGTSVFTGNPYSLTTPATAGTYTYYAGTCPGTYRIPIIITVTSASGPLLSVSATKTITCSGSNDTLTINSSAGGATSYTWSANAGSVTTHTAIVAPTSNTTYTVTGSTSGACAGTNTASISITVNTAPTITITPTSNTLCSGSSTILTATSSASSYTWSSNTGSATTSSVSVSPITNTIYTVTGVNGICTATQTATINVTTTPTVSIAPSNTAIVCNGVSATFTASGATTYSWSTSAITNTISVSPTSNTTYTVIGNNGTCPAATQTVSVTTDGGPTKADSVLNSASCGLPNGDYIITSVTGGVSPYQINFNGAGFTTILSFPDTVKNLSGNMYSVIIKDGLGCAYTTTTTVGNTSAISKIDSVIANASCVPANSGTITINSVIGGTAPYQANINGGSYNAIASFPYSFTNLTAGTYTVLVKDNTNCPHLSIITVGAIGGVTSASITPLPDTCSKQVGTINITNVIGGATPYSYALNSGSYQTANTFTALAAGTDSIKIKDNNGCTYTITTTVGAMSGPTTASVTTTQDTCGKGVGTITVASVTGGTMPYMYGLNHGTYQTVSTFTALATGNDTIKIKDNSGCTYSLTATITNTVIAIVPTITVGGPTTFCQGGSITLTSSSASSYTWSTGAFTQSITVTTGNTTYSVITKSTTGCTATSDTVRVTVIPTTTITVTASTNTICAGNSAILTAALTPTTSTTASYTLSSSIGLSPMSSNTVMITPLAIGTNAYTILGTVGTCSAIPTTTTVMVNPIPTITLTPTNYIVCFGQITTLTAHGANTYTWSPPTGLSSSTGSVVLYAQPIVTTTYTVIGTDVNNCQSLPQTTTLNVIPASPLSISSSTNTICMDSSVTLVASNNLASYTWSPTSATTSSVNVVSPAATTVYSVTGIDGNNCPYLAATTTITVVSCVTYTITIPNVFSPNGDNINDNFEVKATGITNLSCDIYDRWGLKLYTFNGASGYWDGTAKGGKEVDGTYFYVILTTDIKGDNHKYNGFIQLVR